MHACERLPVEAFVDAHDEDRADPASDRVEVYRALREILTKLAVQADFPRFDAVMRANMMRFCELTRRMLELAPERNTEDEQGRHPSISERLEELLDERTLRFLQHAERMKEQADEVWEDIEAELDVRGGADAALPKVRSLLEESYKLQMELQVGLLFFLGIAVGDIPRNSPAIPFALHVVVDGSRTLCGKRSYALELIIDQAA